MTQKVAIIGGDGIGPEVTAQGVRVLEVFRDLKGYPLELIHYDFGADRYLRDGVTFPEEAQRTIREGVHSA